MNLWEWIFFISCFLIFYNYAGYAIIALIINKITGNKKENADTSDFFPSVSFIVAAYNEEDFVETKIENALSLNYPKDKIEFIFVTDGSNDATPALVEKHTAITLLHSAERRGKVAAMNRAVAIAKNDILIFSDANTLLNNDAVKKIAEHYYYKTTGGVAGEKKIMQNTVNNEVGAGEGLYWKYESFLKKVDSDFYSVVGAAGELFSVRKDLFKPASSAVILDDFVISLEVAKAGYKIKYEPNAYAMELPSFSLKDEKKRKIRIAAGGFQAMAMLPELLYFWKHARLSFLYISHRVMRWAVSPFCMILAFLCNFILFVEDMFSGYTFLFFAQLFFYLMAYAGSFISSSKNIVLKIARLCYYFVFMNFSVLLGFARYLKGNQTALWEKAKRASAA